MNCCTVEGPLVHEGESKWVCVGTGNSVTGKCVKMILPPSFVVVVEPVTTLAKAAKRSIEFIIVT